MWRSGILVVCCSGCSFTAGVLNSDAAIDAEIDARGMDTPLDAPTRARAGLIALYTFDEGSGATVTDTASVSPPVNLTILDPSKVTWGPGKLSIDATTIIASPLSVPNRIAQQCASTGAVTVEVWIIPTLATQVGNTPGQFARVATMSVNAGARNFAIGQQGGAWAMQARTNNPSVDVQGSPILSGSSVITTPTHLVLTANVSARALYVNSQLAANDGLGGGLNWQPGYRLAFGAEASGNNPWKGTLLLVAIYDRVLTDSEIGQNFFLGPDSP
jgi:hypothetical protein